MAAIAWEHLEDRADRGYRPAPLRLVSAPPSRRRPSAAVYRRRRLLALVALVVVLGATWLLVSTAMPAGSAAAGAAPISPTVVVATEGDSYWSLAAELHEGGDLRSTVDQLVAANGGRDLRAGDRIVLPTS